MAAYAALVTLSKAIHQILPYEQHYSFLCDKHHMQSLLDKLIRLQKFLEDVSGISSDDIDELESRIRDVAYRLEDIVESILVYSLAMEYQNQVNSQSIKDANSEVISLIREAYTQLPLAAECRAVSRKSVKDGSAEASTSVTASHESTVPSTSAESETETTLDDILGWCLDQDLESKANYSHLPLIARAAAAFGNCIKEAELLFEEVTETMKKALDNKLVIPGTSIVPHDHIATTSLPGGAPDANDTVVGLNDVLNQILDRITSGQRAREVIPITGMGGIGKTTLARAVYDHHGKQDHFDLVLWATVSQQHNVKEILRSLLYVDAEENEPNKTLIELVHQRLFSRRYLIILDDVWDEKVWDGIRNAFPNNNNCSRVILTTRLENVGTYVSSSSTCLHQMQLLSEEQSWDLLRETVYGHEIGCPSKFEYFIGRRISENCKGLPLALIVIGGLLKLSNAEDHWEHVATSTTVEAAADDDSLPRILSLSYSNLPSHLKACFLYFGMFREDEEIQTKELVRLWCAEGFLKPRESKTMEVVAEECLKELVERNLILVKKKRYDGKIKASSIHDVLRDLSLIQAQKEKFLYRHDGCSEIDGDTFLRIIKDQPHRISFPYFHRDCITSFNSPIRTFRTEVEMHPRQLSTIIPQFKLVRVLGTLEYSSSALRNSVRLNNLRYLHLHKTYDDEPLMVPKSIFKLRNLQTLIVSGGYASDEKYDLIFPVEIWEMPRLQHLVSEVKMKLPPLPASDLDGDSSIESLSLQTLTGLLNFDDFTPSVIQKLQNLKKLHIKYIYMPRDDEENELFHLFGLEALDSVVNLHHLEDLTISHSRNVPGVRNIGFPTKLKKLRLEGTKLPWEKMTSIGDSLERLEVLKLSRDAFVGEVWEPIEGGFPQLKYLKMFRLRELEGWRVESAHFPSLEKLVILRCEKLKAVPGEIGDIDTLQKLIVKKHWINDSVGRGFEESVRRIQEESVRAGNDSLKVIILSKDQDLSDVDKLSNV